MDSLSGIAYILFTRVPSPKTTKTRLSGVLSGDERCELQEAMAMDLIEKASALGGPVVLCLSEDEGESDAEARREAFVEAMAQASGLQNRLHVVMQEGAGLGERMHHAMVQVFEAGARGCMLTGSDLPYVTTQDVEKAQHALERADVVFGPSEDGGYWLVGAQAPVPEVFAGKRYGTGSVLEEAMAACAKSGRSVELVGVTNDVDVPDDLALLCIRAMAGDGRLGTRTQTLAETLAPRFCGAGGRSVE